MLSKFLFLLKGLVWRDYDGIIRRVKILIMD